MNGYRLRPYFGTVPEYSVDRDSLPFMGINHIGHISADYVTVQVQSGAFKEASIATPDGKTPIFKEFKDDHRHHDAIKTQFWCLINGGVPWISFEISMMATTCPACSDSCGMSDLRQISYLKN